MTPDGQSYYEWVMAHLDHNGQECLIWPGFIDANGKPSILALPDGRNVQPRRFICEQVYGQKPAKPMWRAAMVCAGKSRGCVHPKHVQWVTASAMNSENFANYNATGWRRKINDAQLRDIIANKGKINQDILARRHGLSRASISRWQKIGFRPVWQHPGNPAGSSRSQVRLDDPLWQSVEKLVPAYRQDRDDIINDIIVAILEGSTSLEILRSQGIRPFTSASNKKLWERGGYAGPSLDALFFDSKKSLHDIIPAERGLYA